MLQSTKPHVNDEEDDVDDLDDVLDQFTPATLAPTSNLRTSAPLPAVNEPTATQQKVSLPDADLEADFAKELGEGMKSLWHDIAQRGSLSDNSGEESETLNQKQERERSLAAAWEAMLIEGMDGSLSQGALDASTSSKATEKDDFQSRIRSAMNKRKENESGFKSSDLNNAATSTDPLEALLSQLGDLGEGEDEDELQGVLEAMMGQLMGKDILYEPLKELSDKFPDYLKTHATTISADDKKRYDAQIICMKQLLEIFESQGYTDDDDKTRSQVVELMGELQKHGSPPEEIMGPLPPGFSMGADDMPNMPDNCVIS